jgi:hypothetical protein
MNTSEVTWGVRVRIAAQTLVRMLEMTLTMMISMMMMIKTMTILMMTTICEIPLHECLKSNNAPQDLLMLQFYPNHLMYV